MSLVAAGSIGGPEVAIILVGLIIPLAGGLIFGFVCRSIAGRKGYSPGGGFCLGFFLGVIGLIICLARVDRSLQYPPGAFPSPPNPAAAPFGSIPPMSPRPPAPPGASARTTAIALALGVSVVMLLAAIFEPDWPFVYWTRWTARLLALGGIGAGTAALITRHRLAIAGGLGAAAAVTVLSTIAIGPGFELVGWALILVLAIAALLAALVLWVVAGRTDPVSRGYPFAPITVALAYAATSALPAFDRENAAGWTIAVAIVVLACLGRGRFAPTAAGVIGLGLVAWWIEEPVFRYGGRDPLELIAAAILVLGSIFLVAASSTLPDARPVRRMSGANWNGVPQSSFAPSAATPTPVMGAAPAAYLTAVAGGAVGPVVDDATIVRPPPQPTWSTPLPPLPTAGGGPAPPPVGPGTGSLSAYNPAASPRAAFQPAAFSPVADSWADPRPGWAHPPARAAGSLTAAQIGDRADASPWWIVLVLFGLVSGVAPFVPFTETRYTLEFADAVPYLVVAAATVVAGILVAAGYVSAYAAAAGLAGVWGVLMVYVVWSIVDIMRWVNEFDADIPIGPGLFLFAASAVLGLLSLIPALAHAFSQAGRPDARRAHPLLGAAVAAGATMLIVDIVRPEYGVSPFSFDTQLSVYIGALVALIGISALLALGLRTGAAHAIAVGVLLLPAATVLENAVTTYPRFDPLSAWGTAIAGSAAAIGVATASERAMRRGRERVRVAAGGAGIAVAGVVVMVSPVIVGLIRTAG